MASAVRLDLPPPLSSTPSTAELRRLLHGLRVLARGGPTGPPLPPAPVPQRRAWTTGPSSEPALVRPFVLAALAEHRR